jgi:hypothetical protein
VTTGKPTSTSEKPRIDSKILIVSSNVLGISTLQAARAAGFLNVTVWERERPALECRSVVRTIERLHATLVVGCRQKSFEHRQVVGEGWLNGRGPFSHTIVCDGLPLPHRPSFFGAIIEPRSCQAAFGIDADSAKPLNDVLDAIRVLCSRPGNPISNHAMRITDKRERFQVFEIPEDYDEDLDGQCYGLGDLDDQMPEFIASAEDQPA